LDPGLSALYLFRLLRLGGAACGPASVMTLWMDPDVLIIGAGLAGLACARRLEQSGISCLLLEAGDAVGGRMRTDHHEGFQLDRGFQVFLTSYPAANALLDTEALALHPFEPGARLRLDGRWHTVHDPFRLASSRDLRATLQAPIGSILDRARVARLRLQLCGENPAEHLEGPDCSTLEYLRARGFSEKMVDRFFRPFYSGIFLEPDLATSDRMFRFTFSMFAAGLATLPRDGMGAIPRQLAGGLRRSEIRFNSPVARLAGAGVSLADGSSLNARAVVLAVDAPAAARLLDDRADPGGKSVTCLYFATPEPPLDRALVTLDGDHSGPVHNLAVLSNVCPSYSPDSRALVSLTVLGRHEPDSLVPPVLAQMAGWFPQLPATAWQYLRGYHISHALPAHRPGHHGPGPTPEGVILAGDHRTHGSIEGAVVSGLQAAEHVLGRLGGRAATPLPADCD
jgi:phytoene dehydrogenase-like protein